MDKIQESFPIIDLSPVLKYIPWKEEFQQRFIEDSSILQLSCKISEAFSTWGFIYIKNHGIDENCIASAYEASENFFELDAKNKELVLQKNDPDGNNWGYVPFNCETFQKDRPSDLRECFNFLPNTNKKDVFNQITPEFMEKETSLYKACHDLSIIFMYLLSLQLPVDNINFLHKNHSAIAKLNENPTMLRLLYYPAISTEEKVKENQIRCGEHSDYGTFTLLFQNGPGLQVLGPAGEYLDATPIPGTIVVNAADLLEIWSAGKFKSVKHRVRLPDIRDQVRQSIGFFCNPDCKVNVRCLDGSDKYQSVIAFEYLLKKMSEIYE